MKAAHPGGFILRRSGARALAALAITNVHCANA
jgi:hypothetical protein